MNTSHRIAGVRNFGSYREGIGSDARFRWIIGYLQPNASIIIAIDWANDCFRTIDRHTNQTQRYAGNCTNRGFRNGPADQALFYQPNDIISDLMDSEMYIVTDKENQNGYLRLINSTSLIVSTLVSFASLDPLYRPKGLLQDPRTGDLYTYLRCALVKYDYIAKTLTVITGKFERGLLDGPFTEALFREPQRFVYLDPKRLLLVDRGNNVLRILDMNTNTTSTICNGASGHVDGNFSVCQFENPQTIYRFNDTFYIGEDHRMRAIQGKGTDH